MRVNGKRGCGYLRWLLGMGVGLGLTSMAVAQESGAEDVNQDAASDQIVEEIVVTGTRIAGVEPVGSNLQVVTQEELRKFPAQNIADTLKRQPAFTGIGLNATQRNSSGPGVRGANTARAVSINLRGIGPKATLVLFDGNRAPPTGSTGRNLGVHNIPSLPLERVEVLLDGGSAIYGSDAVAGVVNFIPRHRFGGVEANVRGTTADDWSSTHLGIMGGQDWGSGGYVLSYEHRRNSSLNGSERSYWRNDLRDEGGYDYRSNECNPGNIVIDGVSYAIPEGGVTQATADQLVPNTENRCDLDRFVDIYGKTEYDTFYAGFEQDLTDRLRVQAHGVYSKRTVHVLDTDIGSTHLFRTYTMTDDNPHFITVPGTTATSYSVRHAFTERLDEYSSDLESRYINADLNVEYDLVRDWTLTADLHWGRWNDEVFTIGPLPQALDYRSPMNSITVSDPEFAFNPYCGVDCNNPAVLDNIFSRYYDPTGEFDVYEATVDVSGSLYELPGGDLKVSVGSQFTRTEAYLTNHLGDMRVPGGIPPLREQNPMRDVTSGFIELYVPVFGPVNARPGFESLELTAAIRYDDYSDLEPGDTTNPKLGLDWVPVNGVEISASYGTSFIAPFLNDTESPAIGGALNYIAEPDPLAGGEPTLGVMINNGNPNLTPEEATTWTFGIDYTGLEDFQFKVAYFNIDYKGLIDSPDRDQILFDPLLQHLVTRNVTQELLDSLPSRYAVDFRENPPAVEDVNWIMDTRPQNLGGSKATGIDVLVRYDRATDFGMLWTQVAATYMFKYEVAQLPGAEYQDELNDLYKPVELKARADVGLMKGAFTSQVSLNYVNSITNNLVDPHESIDSVLTLDLRLGVSLDELGFAADGGWFTGIEAALDVQNVFDSDPPYANIVHGVDTSNLSALGRTVALSVTKRFE